MDTRTEACKTYGLQCLVHRWWKLKKLLYIQTTENHTILSTTTEHKPGQVQIIYLHCKQCLKTSHKNFTGLVTSKLHAKRHTLWTYSNITIIIHATCIGDFVVNIRHYELQMLLYPENMKVGEGNFFCTAPRAWNRLMTDLKLLQWTSTWRVNFLKTGRHYCCPITVLFLLS